MYYFVQIENFYQPLPKILFYKLQFAGLIDIFISFIDDLGKETWTVNSVIITELTYDSRHSARNRPACQ